MFKKPTAQSTAVTVNKYIGSAYNDLEPIMDNMDALLSLSASVDELTKYLGAYTEPPQNRVSGDPLQDGDYYFDTTDTLEAIVYYDIADATWFAISADEILAFAVRAETAAGESEDSAITSVNASVLAAASAASIGDAVTETATSASASAASAVLSELSNTESASNRDITNDNVGKTSSDVLLTNADVITTVANVAVTNADVVITNADIAITNADVLLTNADVIATNADVVTTTADAATTTTAKDTAVTAASSATVSANTAHTYSNTASASAASATASQNTAQLDATATAADRVQTGLDVISAKDARDIALANANFKGDWFSLTGALDTPASVRHVDILWMLTAPITNVTAEEPSVSNKWFYLGTITGVAADSLLLDGQLPSYYLDTSNMTDTSNSRFVTDSDISKLGGIESSATADQTDAEIKTAYENNSNTNAFTDTDVSTLASAVQFATVGVANGVAALGADGIVPTNQLPSYVDDVVEYANFAAFPTTGISSQLYVALDTNKVWRWSGTQYVEISESMSGSDIKTLYEGEANTNAFTDALNTKLTNLYQGEVNVATNLTASQTSTTVTIESSTGTNVILSGSTTTDAGVMTSTQHDKLDGIASGANVNVATNLTNTTNAANVTVVSSTGTDTILPAATTSTAGVMVASDKLKLSQLSSSGFAATIILSATDNLDSVITEGIYGWNTSTPSNAPFADAILMVSNDGSQTIQKVWGSVDSGRMAIRRFNSGVPAAWSYSATLEDDNTFTGNNTFTDDIEIANSKSINLGTAKDLRMSSDSSDAYFDSYNGSNLYLRDGDNSLDTRFTFDTVAGNFTASGSIYGSSGEVYSDSNIPTAATIGAAGASATVGDFVIGDNVGSTLHVRHIDGKNVTDNGDADLYLNFATGKKVFIGSDEVYHAGNLPETTSLELQVVVATPSTDLDTVANGEYGNYSGTAAWTNKPSWLGYGVIVSQSDTNLGYQLAFDINHNSTSTGKFGYRTKNNLGFHEWKTIPNLEDTQVFEADVTISGVADLSGGTLGLFDDTQTYRGLLDKEGTTTGYISTPTQGLLPKTSGSNGTIGTAAYNFNTIYGGTIYEGNVALSAKYQAIGSYNRTVGTETDVSASGDSVKSTLGLTEGVITSATYRDMAPSDIGAGNLTSTNTWSGGTQTFNSANQLVDIDASRARIHVGVDAAGVGGTLGSMVYDGEGGTALSYGMYLAYDCYIDPATDLWAANRTTTSNKWVQTMGVHTDAVNFYRFAGDVASQWKTSDMSLMFAVEDDKVYCGNSIEAPAFVSKEALSTHVLTPEGGSTKVSGTGAIQIKLPKSRTNTMLTIVIEVYDYNLSQSFDVRVAGYSHTSGWINSKIDVDGASNYNLSNVRIGWDASADNCIWIGELTSGWLNTTVTVKSVTASYSNFDSGWDSGWVISLNSTSFSTVNNDHLTGKSIERIGSLGFKERMGLYNYSSTALKLESTQSTTSLRLHTSDGYQGSIYGTSDTFGLLDTDDNWAVKIDTGVDTALYVNNVERLAASTVGVAVNGSLQVNSTDGTAGHSFSNDSDSSRLNLGSASNTENRIQFYTKNDVYLGAMLGTSAGNFGLLDADDNWGLRIDTDVSTALYVNNVKRLVADDIGAYCRGRLQIDSSDGTVGHIFTNDSDAATMNIKSQSNTDNYLKFYTRDSTYLGALVGAGDTFGLLGAGNDWGVRINKDTSTEVFYNNAVKLETTATGVDITGELTQNGGTDLQTQIDTAVLLALASSLF